MSQTLSDTIDQLHYSLRDYIEAAYHISDPTLILQRRRLLDTMGVIHQKPYIESTPRYITQNKFAEMEGLDQSILELLINLSHTEGTHPQLIHDPPYKHQYESLQEVLVDNRSVVVMTGTGSGKTECFLLPMLGKLLREAHRLPNSFRNKCAIRGMLLYPMNALVNDQLGRLRLLFCDERVVSSFTTAAGRPARFARYTSRTLYPGVRTKKKDQDKLKVIGKYYVNAMLRANDQDNAEERRSAIKLISELKKRGKWPGKPDLLRWYGNESSRWQDSHTGEYKRCVTIPDDVELLTRHEVQMAPPDIVVTNYSMLEYMLMRPIERSIFDMTREWLHECPTEKFLLVVDEAHLYRGAAGAEVALLLRRLRMRLEIPPERLQIICTSASFQDPNYASEFAAQLTGKHRDEFDTITGDLDLRPDAGRGGPMDVQILSQIDLDALHSASTPNEQLAAVRPFLEYRNITMGECIEKALYDALREYPPMSSLVNVTMQGAIPVEELGQHLWSGVDGDSVSKATTALAAIGCLARPFPDQPSLLPCRVHSLHRGLPGIWACMDPQCSLLAPDERGGPTGKIYGQPRAICACGATVLELYTCRICGAAYARAYSDNLDTPDYLWSEPGEEFRTANGVISSLLPLDLLLETPTSDDVELAEYDLTTGRLNPRNPGDRTRQVYLKRDRFRTPNPERAEVQGPLFVGEFNPCGVCERNNPFNRTSIMDHQTKGDQPYQALITKQIQVQLPTHSDLDIDFSPLQGRKVLVFSDSRQIAARLAPNLQTYSTRDALRPLIVHGMMKLNQVDTIQQYISLEDVYLAVLLSSALLGVRLRPELKHGETFAAKETVRERVEEGVLNNNVRMVQLLFEIRASIPPSALLLDIISCMFDQHYGLQSLALASLDLGAGQLRLIENLPTIDGLAETTEQKRALVALWLDRWQKLGVWTSGMPTSWWGTEVRGHSGNFEGLNRLLSRFNGQRLFLERWIPTLVQNLAERVGQKYRLKGVQLNLNLGGNWELCSNCKAVLRPFPALRLCPWCLHESRRTMDPNMDTVFKTRKGYYRSNTLAALSEPPVAPVSLIAAEHTAQLNTAQSQQAFSRAEEYELLFQDVDIGMDDSGRPCTAVDVLSCTTTMEVGIDIGALSGVSLRNMPPSRANYQQRAGRAGRRGAAIATVTAFANADSHDDHFFNYPDALIRGLVDDPVLTIDNDEIIKRHVTAYLLQRYHRDTIREIRPEDQPQLFEVLGTVSGFRSRNSIINRGNFLDWMTRNAENLRREIDSWLPIEFSGVQRSNLLQGLVENTINDIDMAINDSAAPVEESSPPAERQPDHPFSETSEALAEPGLESPDEDPLHENLLNRLLYKGVLPRYAFPTDVATFHVFNSDMSSRFRPVFQYTPSQGMSIALSQYAPGKEVWVDGKRYRSQALYSPMRSNLYECWERKRLYFECETCGYAKIEELSNGQKGDVRNCPACGGQGTFGAARYWVRPPGFAHPCTIDAGTSPDDQPPPSYATRAKLSAETPADNQSWRIVNPHLKVYHMRDHLLVTNRGPRREGYSYCTRCGLIEPTAGAGTMTSAAHQKPYPDNRAPTCDGGRTSRAIVLGTDFLTDVLLISLRVEPPVLLLPGLLGTDVALRTLSEAIVKASCELLELEEGELQAEFRPALSQNAARGLAMEIYIYDTLPGGAGFSRRVGELQDRVLHRAMEILDDCDCDSSCYKCLRSYKNKLEHRKLDRVVGSALLRYLLQNEVPKVSSERTDKLLDLLCEDLRRQCNAGITFHRNCTVNIPGIGDLVAPILCRAAEERIWIIALADTLTPQYVEDKQIRDAMEFGATVPILVADEIVILRNLPYQTRTILESITRS